MPNWTLYFQTLVLLAIGGFALVILSGFWHILALLIVAFGLWMLWRQQRRPSR